MDSKGFDLDLLAKETLALSETFRSDFEQQKLAFSDDMYDEFVFGSDKPEQSPVVEESLPIVEESVPDEFSSMLEQMAFETMNFSEPETKSDFVEEVVEVQESESTYPQSSGILYRIDGGVSTFSVKGICVDNIEDTFHELSDNESELWKHFKVEEKDISLISFFETKNRELAEVVADEMLNRRFPVEEDMVCNISDPGFSWWMDESEKGFQIFFKSFGTDRAQKYTRLGPLGDSGIAELRFRQAENLIRSFFPVNEFASTDKFFSISTVKENHLSYQVFKNIFTFGENNTTLEQFPDSREGRTLFFYFQELAALRSFWIEVESKISQK